MKRGVVRYGMGSRVREATLGWLTVCGLLWQFVALGACGGGQGLPEDAAVGGRTVTGGQGVGPRGGQSGMGAPGGGGGSTEGNVSTGGQSGGTTSSGGDTGTGGTQTDGGVPSVDGGDAAVPIDTGPSNDGGADAQPVPVAACRLCPVGQKFCNGKCRPPTDPLLGCGKACYPCLFDHASGACDSAGRCTMGQCAAGFADCNKDPSDGCEADLSSAANCLTCGSRCPAGTVCTTTGCAATCPGGLTTCNGRCADIASSATACGGCSPCPSAPNGTSSCVSGRCEPITCAPGMTLCQVSDGKQLCVDTMNDPANCGACGRTCDGNFTYGMYTCAQGTCVNPACLPGWTSCGTNNCTLVSFDSANCGSCGHACAPTEFCADSTCHPQTDQLLVSGVDQPGDLVVSGNDLFFSTLAGGGAIYKVAITGGTPLKMASGLAKPSRIAVDSTHIYWVNELAAAVMRMARDGGASPEMVVAAQLPRAVTLDGDYVYWTESDAFSSGVVKRARKGAPVTGIEIAAQPFLYLAEPSIDIAVLGNTVYAWGRSFVVSAPIGGTLTLIISGVSTGFALDSSHQFRLQSIASSTFYWSDRFDSTESAWTKVSANLASLAATPCGAQFAGGFFPISPQGSFAVSAYPIRIPGASSTTSGDNRIVYQNGYSYWTENGATAPALGSIKRVRTPLTSPM